MKISLINVAFYALSFLAFSQADTYGIQRVLKSGKSAKVNKSSKSLKEKKEKKAKSSKIPKAKKEKKSKEKGAKMLRTLMEPDSEQS